MEKTKIFEVKEFDPAYVGIINELLSQLISSPVPFTDTDLQTMIVSGSSHLFLISYEDEIAGMLTVGSYKTPTGQKHWIEDVVVDQRFRGKALGYKLVEHAIRYVESLGNSILMLTSSPARVAANQLYRSVGFEPKETNVYKMTFKK
ncbi:GNAT family N-acetyltransferase [Parabacteroides chongii]|uniref:GNAT family N-acetyltransferase n=1 Tax=Parabacteroides chongii TaxID=2685834 RepID=UPI00240D9322|nr:GNAT family N-acetyltransferase [Parabacteroides chongii]WFE85848.1 GNAT family N-acetyltransferase [Parabacteroides chongii]